MVDSSSDGWRPSAWNTDGVGVGSRGVYNGHVLASIAARSVQRVQIDQSTVAWDTIQLHPTAAGQHPWRLTTHVVSGARSTNFFTPAVVTGYRVTQPTTPVWQTASVLLSLTNCGPYKSRSPPSCPRQPLQCMVFQWYRVLRYCTCLPVWLQVR